MTESVPKTSAQHMARWPVMVLAHNEERHIVACLDSIFRAERGVSFDVYVMANGCTDGTEAIVREYARRVPDVHLVSISFGDKCNAWNEFIHEVLKRDHPQSDIVFFMDGDAWAMPGSFAVMAEALERNEYAHAAAAVPVSGRNVEKDRAAIIAEHGLVANLYALRGAFVRRLQTLQVRLPIHLEGDDGLLGALVKWDLDPKHGAFDDERIVPCGNAGFGFERMALRRPRDLKAYWKRAIRYGRRQYEFQLLGKRLKAEGLAGLPNSVIELYNGACDLPLRKAGVYTLTNWIALRQMRRVALAPGKK